ncbi:MAG TPA: hypothetical protein VKU02_25630, partial [Gemmataceae bacterium]|nr:hypothetical protein [Gemmataceae bacterium]
NIKGLPEWGTVSCIDASPFDAGTAYVVVDAHRLDDLHPYLVKTSDYGKTWTSLAEKLPVDIYLHAVREDPKRKGLLYVGTERGVAFSIDDGATWQQLKLNLPTVAVHDLIVKNNDLVVGTHGRSIWILDDVTPLRELSPQIAGADSHFFPVQPAIRYRSHPAFHAKEIGQNPPAGAILNYYLKAKTKDPITIEILDTQGKLITTLKSKPKKEPPANGPQRLQVEQKPKLGPKEAEEEEVAEDDPDAPFEKVKKTVLTTEIGVNRVAWDLHYKGAEKIKGAKVDAGLVDQGPLVNPGTYTLKLTVDGKTLTTTAVVQADPRTHISPTDLEEQLKFALAIRDDLNRLVQMVNQIRSIRKQLIARDDLLQGNSKRDTLIQAGQELIGKLDALEEKLHNPKAEVTYDILAQRGGAKLYSQFAFLFESVKDSDGLPTQGMREVYAEQAQALKQYGSELNALISGDLAKLNETAKNLDIPNIIVSAPATSSEKGG